MLGIHGLTLLQLWERQPEVFIDQCRLRRRIRSQGCEGR
jgi:hypothetical protein